MRILLLLLLVQADDKKDLTAVVARMNALKSYRCVLTFESAGKKNVVEVVWADGFLHYKSEDGELARNDSTAFVKKDGEWREIKRAPEKAKAPHETVEKLVDLVPALKKEKSDKVAGVTVDVYAYALGPAEAAKAYEDAGKGIASTWHDSFVDWTKTKNGVVFWVGRRDDLVYKLEQRFAGRTKGSGKESEHVLTMEFSLFNAAKHSLPDDVKARLKN
jgi:hypothetical protein